VLAISAIILFSVSTAFEIHSFVSSFSENHTLLIKFIRILTALCFDDVYGTKNGKKWMYFCAQAKEVGRHIHVHIWTLFVLDWED
jgi:hypothetical protein